MKESDFGFKKYNKKEHSYKVKDVFNKVANKYDLMNDVMSLGMQRLWKKEFIESINPSKDENLIFIDLAGGTGDITKRILSKYKKNTAVKVIDINQEMLKEGKNSFKSHDNIDFICSFSHPKFHFLFILCRTKLSDSRSSLKRKISGNMVFMDIVTNRLS